MATVMNRSRSALAALLAAAACSGIASPHADACGGFFCQVVPIDQAAEQIIFRQTGNQVTAVVLIQYQGDATEFSWVVPVPGVPELSVGSDLVFQPLELATRPQFILETRGALCPGSLLDEFVRGGLASGAPDFSNEDDGVQVLERLAVGPFAIEIVTSDDAQALATWLTDNDYDLTDRGRELIAPYVDEGMNFVAVRLQQDQGVGDIQPLIMRYVSEKPTIPIRLTAVAAMPDMGVVVWLLGPSRAVPLNYLHVVPNYTLLNWYAGTLNAYASYQGLITAAMNEVGGQGFATDYAGRDLDVLAQLPSVQTFTQEMTALAGIADDAGFVAALAGNFVFPQDKTIEILRRELPLPEGNDEFVYQVPELLSGVFTPEQLSAARSDIVTELNDTVIAPLEETLAVLDGGHYLTRMYTTLSAEEMTLDPTFFFNPDLGEQQRDRNALLDVNCNTWSLTLGKGTGRDGERVINGVGPPPAFIVPAIGQENIWQTATMSTSGAPQVVTQKNYAIARVSTRADGSFRICGAGLIPFLLMSSAVLLCARGRRPSPGHGDT